ncbi:MAG: hypothetical protein K0Q79_2720 [Flavipsychrobacter sp.]|jgi:hypothetical protein|nr:hypothetical protein [Flavipsychrobacter sp.]
MKKYLLIVLPLLMMFSCKNVAKYPMDEPMPELVNDGLIGKWQANEDSDKNNIIVITKSNDSFKYDLKYWENGGSNPKYVSQVHFSKINETLFLNVACWDDIRNDKVYYQKVGYIFFKVVYATPDYSKLVLTTVSDTSLCSLKSGLEVFNRIAKNLNNKAYYHDTLHFYKLNP